MEAKKKTEIRYPLTCDSELHESWAGEDDEYNDVALTGERV